MKKTLYFVLAFQFLAALACYSADNVNPIVTVTPVRTYIFNGSPQGPSEASNNGTGTSYTFSYVGTGATSYGPNATLPTAAGTYTATATVEATTGFNSASSQPTAFTIFEQDPLKLFLTNIPAVSEVISTTDSGTGTTAITTKRFTFKSKEGVNTIYAIMAYPKAAGVYPGILMYHGGGGTAEGLVNNLQTYTALGYVTMALDEPGIASVANSSSYSTGPWKSVVPGEGPKLNVVGGVQNSTLYDAIIGSVEAFNLLSSQPNVNAQKMALTGSSWGGYLTTFTAGLLGSRVKAAYSTWGCGFYETGSFWSGFIAQMPAHYKSDWLTYLDAGRRAKDITAPYFIDQATNDTYFWPEAVSATLNAITATKNHVTMANLNHATLSSSAATKQLYMNYYLKGVGSPFGTINITGSETQSDGSLKINMNVSLPVGVSISSVKLYYSVPTSTWQTRNWIELPATLVSGINYQAIIPEFLAVQGVNYYANMIDSRQVQTSSDMYKTSTTNIPVTGVVLLPATLTLSAGSSQQLAATITPANASNKNVTWTSSDTNVATVNSLGLVTSVAPGTCNITVTTQDGEKTAIAAITVNPRPVNKILSDCDSNSGWTSGNTLTVNSTDKKEGAACLQTVGSKTNDFMKVFSPPVNTGSTIENGNLQFWYFVSDITSFDAGNQVELGSGGAADKNEFSWNIGTLQNGWNLVTLPFKTAAVTGGTPDLSAINWFRIYHIKTASVTTKIDQIIIVDNSTNAVSNISLSGVSVFPNPLNQDKLTIKMEDAADSDAFKITISNLHGQIVYQNNISGKNFTEINTAGWLKSSVYLVSVQSGKAISSSKLIVQ
jgi:cephalosporin-C deacetylase-like acetyl esterase